MMSYMLVFWATCIWKLKTENGKLIYKTGILHRSDAVTLLDDKQESAFFMLLDSNVLKPDLWENKERGRQFNVEQNNWWDEKYVQQPSYGIWVAVRIFLKLVNKNSWKR